MPTQSAQLRIFPFSPALYLACFFFHNSAFHGFSQLGACESRAKLRMLAPKAALPARY
jgi:hypothetical protein